MQIAIVPTRGTITASSGTGNATFNSKHYLCRKIYIKAATNTTTFDATLTDRYGDVVWGRYDNIGELSENLVEPGYGNWTLTILNSSADEIFTYTFAFQV